MEVSSTSYIVFDTSTNASVIDIDSSNQLPGVSAVVPYSFSADQIQLSAGFSATETSRKAMCLKPSIIVAGVQTFVAFNIPALPSGTAAEVWLSSADGKHHVSASIVSKSSGGQQLLLTAGSDTDVQLILLQTNVEYVMLIAVDSSGGFLTAQVVTVKNVPISTSSVYVSDQSLSNALQTDAFFVCVALSSTTSRKLVQAKSVSMNIRYYGKQRVGTAGTLATNKRSSIDGGTIAGAVIGAVLGCMLLIIIATVVVLVVYYFTKKRVPVNKQPEEQVFVALQEIVTPTEEVPYVIPETVTTEPPVAEKPQDSLPESSEIVATLQEPEQHIDEPEESIVVETPATEQVTLGIESELELDDEGKKKLSEMKDIITDIRSKVSKITNRNISELQAYATPPPVVFSVLRASLILLGYDADDVSKWGTCKKRLKEEYLKKISQFDPTDSSHTSNKFKLAKEEIKELDYETCLKKGSLPTAILSDWLRGVLQIRTMAVSLRTKKDTSVAVTQEQTPNEQPIDEAEVTLEHKE
jgi:hypothetical protein